MSGGLFFVDGAIQVGWMVWVVMGERISRAGQLLIVSQSTKLTEARWCLGVDVSDNQPKMEGAVCKYRCAGAQVLDLENSSALLLLGRVKVGENLPAGRNPLLVEKIGRSTSDGDGPRTNSYVCLCRKICSVEGRRRCSTGKWRL